MKLTTEFYQDEVRYGFYVPTAIKQAWGQSFRFLQRLTASVKNIIFDTSRSGGR